jgi:hypothetical protein
MFRALLAHSQEALHGRRIGGYCVQFVDVGWSQDMGRLQSSHILVVLLLNYNTMMHGQQNIKLKKNNCKCCHNKIYEQKYSFG